MTVDDQNNFSQSHHEPDFLNDISESNDVNHVADTQFLHALLSTLLHPLAAVQNRKRVKGVIDAISREPSDGVLVNINTYRQTHWLRRAAIGAAAVVMIGVLSYFVTMPSRVAMATVSNVIQATEQTIGRVYEVSHIYEPDQNASSAKVNYSKLYFKGTNKFLMESKGFDGNKMLVGRNGEINWFMKSTGPIMTSPDRGYCGPKGHQPKLPYINLKTGLDELKEHYTITLSAPEKLPAYPDAKDPDIRNSQMMWHKLHGVRKKNQYGPNEMTLWYHPEKGYVRRMTLTGFEKDERMRPPSRKDVERNSDTTIATNPVKHTDGPPPPPPHTRQFEGDKPDRPQFHKPRPDDDRKSRDRSSNKSGDDKSRDRSSSKSGDDKSRDWSKRRESDHRRSPYFFKRPNTVVFNLVDQRDIEDSWFNHESHHDGTRELKEFKSRYRGGKR